MFLQSALRPSILDDVLRRDPQPTSYNEWKTAILKADQNLCNSAATRSFHSNPSLNPSHRQNSSSFIPFPYRNPSSNKPPSIINNNTTLNPQAPPTKLRPSAGTTTSNANNVNCWKCNGPHYSNKCPQNATSNPKLRALIEHFDEIDSAYETASAGTESICKMLDSEVEGEDSECHALLERLVNEHPVFVRHDE